MNLDVDALEEMLEKESKESKSVKSKEKVSASSSNGREAA